MDQPFFFLLMQTRVMSPSAASHWAGLCTCLWTAGSVLVSETQDTQLFLFDLSHPLLYIHPEEDRTIYQRMRPAACLNIRPTAHIPTRFWAQRALTHSNFSFFGLLAGIMLDAYFRQHKLSAPL